MTQKLSKEAYSAIENIASSGVRLLKGEWNSGKTNFQNVLKRFFKSKTDSLNTVARYLDQATKDIEKRCKQEEEAVKKFANHISREAWISITGDIQAVRREMESWRKQPEFFIKEWSNRSYYVSESKVFKSSEYGQGSANFFNQVRKLNKINVNTVMHQLETAMAEGDLSVICKYTQEQLLQYVWFYAMEKPCSMTTFQWATDLYERMHDCPYTKLNTDVDIVKLYAKHQIGGEDAVRKDVSGIFEFHAKETGPVWQRNAPAYYGALASALMWMQCYQLEKSVLQHMLNRGLEMSAQQQNRLHMLTKGGGKTMTAQTRTGNGGELMFDVSALSWRQEQYENLFEQLAFQERKLTYALAVRDEDKGVILAPGSKKPSTLTVAKQLKAVMDDEYGDVVHVKGAMALAMSGDNKEELAGILITTDECPQMSLYVSLFGIGKKLNIKFYTLYMPGTGAAAVQKQQILSLYRQLSPQTSMWESSLKESTLMGIQQLLNAGGAGQTGAGQAGSLKQGHGLDDELVF